MSAGSAVQVAVCDRATSYRRGLGAVLTAAGYVTVDLDDVGTQPLASGVAALLLTIREARDWDLLRKVSGVDADLKVVALLVDPTPDRHAEALRRGAHGAVGWEAPPEAIVSILSAALDGLTVLPTAVAQAISSSGPPLHDPGWMTPEEVEWLKLLAKGVTVQELAAKAGFSERAQYRLLHGLYGKMRVANRTEAILQASRWGLLDE